MLFYKANHLLDYNCNGLRLFLASHAWFFLNPLQITFRDSSILLLLIAYFQTYDSGLSARKMRYLFNFVLTLLSAFAVLPEHYRRSFYVPKHYRPDGMPECGVDYVIFDCDSNGGMST